MKLKLDDTNRIRELELTAIIVCEQSDGYLKEWARKELEKLEKKSKSWTT